MANDELSFARQQAWADFENAAKRVLQLERMGRLKIDYSLYGEELDGTNELVRNPKRRVQQTVKIIPGRGRIKVKCPTCGREDTRDLAALSPTCAFCFGTLAIEPPEKRK